MTSNAYLELRRFVNDGPLMKLVREAGEKKASESLVDKLVALGIKYIASDFDLTMTTVHSGGPICLSSKKCATVLASLSPSFDEFATYACKRGIRICVVTFNDASAIPPGSTGLLSLTSPVKELDTRRDDMYLGGTSLVEQVLKECNAQFRIERVYAYYPPLYGARENFRALGLNRPMPNSKSYHLDSLCADFQLPRSAVLLIDDDYNNCCSAAQEGYPTLTVCSRRGFRVADVKVV